MKTVWVAEREGYPDETYFEGVFASFESAVAAIKEPYGSPYRVRWDEPVIGDDARLVLTGHFERVPDYSTEHIASWNIWKEPVR